MVTRDQINRINELAKKDKSEGLSSEEKKEQKVLRDLYVSSFKDNLISQLNMIKIEDKNPKTKKN